MTSLYRQLDVDAFEPTEHCASAWGAHLQHGGPVVGLLTRAMSRLGEPAHRRIGRVTTEILSAVRMEPVTVSARIERPGRRIELLTSTMNQAGREVARATAWRLRTADTAAIAHHALPPTSGPTGRRGSAADIGFPEGWISGFVEALDWDVADAGSPGVPTTVWTRLKVDLVDTEPISPLERVVTTSDGANGIGARLDPLHFTFPNTETTVHLYDAPEGELVGIAAETSVGGDGIAMSTALLSSRGGPVGRVTQTSLVEARA